MHCEIGSVLHFLTAFLSATLLMTSSLVAGTTGKIVGKITDRDTNEPLSSAQVRLEGTTIGTLTDENGHYFLLDVSPGIYSVVVSLIGHQEVTKVGVEVILDGTTRVDFQLGTRILEMPTMTITAERPLLRKDFTSTVKSISDKKIRAMPVDHLDDILKLQPGFVTDATGELHIRGGRAGEVAYFIDGIPIENTLFGGINSLLNDDAINQLLILSGTFSAEYGDALSGVVNVVTKEGADTFHGRAEYKSVMINKSPYRQRDWAGEGVDSQRNPLNGESLYSVPDVFNQNVRLPLPGSFSTSFGGPVLGVGGLSFFLATRSDKENSYLPFGHHLEEDLTWKLSYRVGEGRKLNILGQNSQNEFQDYRHAWKYRPDHKATNFETSDRIGIVWKQNVSNSLFYTIVGSYDRQHSDILVKDKALEEYIRSQTDPSLSFYVEGDEEVFQKSSVTTSLGKIDFVHQRGSRHEIKTGGEIKLHDISLNSYEEAMLDREELFRKKPLEGAVYLLDKLEYDTFVLNAGLRFDFVAPRAKMWRDPENPESPLMDVPFKSQLSPRIGMSHPVTDKSIIYFSYGHFFQIPEYDLFFSNTRNLVPENLDDLTFGSVGNRNINPQKTVAYEVGVKQELTDNLGLGVTAFFKDITNLVGSEEVRIATENSSYHYTYFSNVDYANVKGIVLTLDRRYAQHLAWDLNYTYSIAKGNHSFPLEGFFNVFFEQPEENQDFFLDFDKRHVISADVTLDTGGWKGPEVMGYHPLSHTGLSAIVQYSSGLPYTPSSGVPGLLLDKNSARLPWTGTVDINFYKDFPSRSFRQTFFVEITNLFDRRNVFFVNPETGTVWQTTGGEGASAELKDAAFDPGDVGPPRIVRIGLRASF